MTETNSTTLYCTTFDNNPLATQLLYIELITIFIALLFIVSLYCCCKHQRYKKKVNKTIPGADQYLNTDSTCCC